MVKSFPVSQQARAKIETMAEETNIRVGNRVCLKDKGWNGVVKYVVTACFDIASSKLYYDSKV